MYCALICIERYWSLAFRETLHVSKSSGDLDDLHAAGEAGLDAPLLSGPSVRHAVHLTAPVFQLLLEAALLVPAPAWVSSVSAALPTASPHRLQPRSAAVEARRLGREEPARSEDHVWVPAFERFSRSSVHAAAALERLVIISRRTLLLAGFGPDVVAELKAAERSGQKTLLGDRQRLRLVRRRRARALQLLLEVQQLTQKVEVGRDGRPLLLHEPVNGHVWHHQTGPNEFCINTLACQCLVSLLHALAIIIALNYA